MPEPADPQELTTPPLSAGRRRAAPGRPADTAAIRRYYDQNTRLFLAWGQPRTYTIHRGLWAPGVTSHAQALNHSHELLLAEARFLAQRDAPARLRLADLGCGVGGSLFYLLERLAPALGVGCTLSPAQARLAAGRRAALKLGNPCLVLEADFHCAPLAAGFDLVYSVEAFVHAAEPARYLAEAARLLRPGGRLMLIDDFRAPGAVAGADPAALRWLAAYQAGWHVPNLRPPAEAADLAAAQGLRLVGDRDLTPLIRLRALPEALAEILLALGRRAPPGHAIVPSMVGSLALQQCLRAGWITYRALTFERAG